jgi:hypothetical protein
LPQKRAEACGDEYKQIAAAYKKLIMPHVNRAQAMRVLYPGCPKKPSRCPSRLLKNPSDAAQAIILECADNGGALDFLVFRHRRIQSAVAATLCRRTPNMFFSSLLEELDLSVSLTSLLFILSQTPFLKLIGITKLSQIRL